jgi:hypothetical protein
MPNTLLNFLLDLVKEAQVEVIPGIADPKKSTAPPRANNKLWEYVVQKHIAERAGRHFDLRLSDDDIAYSWAIRKGLPEPGKKHLAKKQPDHSPDYMDFVGYVKSKYGRGPVTQEDRSKMVKILKSRPDLVKFILLHKSNPQEFNLIKTKDKDWLLHNITPIYDKLGLDKPKYKNVSEADVHEKYMGSGYALQPKIDGANTVVDFGKQIIRLFSPRKSKRIEDALQYTYHMPDDVVLVDHGLKGTRARAEIFFLDKKGKKIPSAQVAGILNSSPLNAIRKIKEGGLTPKIYLFNIDTFKNKDVSNRPYKDKLEMLRKIDKETPDSFIYPESAVTQEEKTRLLLNIKDGQHPYTEEGVVIYNLNTADIPKKFKVRDTWDVYIRQIVPGARGAAGFRYSYTPHGKIVGKVGTGFTDKQRFDMLKNPDKYIGKVAVVDSQERYPSGSLRAPSFKHLHLEK